MNEFLKKHELKHGDCLIFGKSGKGEDAERWVQVSKGGGDDPKESKELYEGAVREVQYKKYERNPENRALCIKHNGTTCKVCGFIFAEKYGDLGEKFIEVHHITPLSIMGGKSTKIDPVTDLVPLCANCHRMIHRGGYPPLTIKELKDKFEKQKNTPYSLS